eukprot:5406495-Amphidinium_carterae.1
MPSRRCRARKRCRAISRPAQKPRVESTSPWGTPRSVEHTSLRLAVDWMNANAGRVSQPCWERANSGDT